MQVHIPSDERKSCINQTTLCFSANASAGESESESLIQWQKILTCANVYQLHTELWAYYVCSHDAHNIEWHDDKW